MKEVLLAALPAIAACAGLVIGKWIASPPRRKPDGPLDVCRECGIIVASREIHTTWHAERGEVASYEKVPR